MSDKKKDRGAKLFEGMIIYTIGNLGSKILSFLLVPMYTYYIVPSEMGVYDLALSTINMLLPIVTLQIADAAYRWLARGGGDEYKTTAIQIVLSNSLLTLLAFGIVSRFVTIDYPGYICAIMVSSALLEVLQKILRGIGNQRLFALSGVLYTFAFLILNVYQITIMHNGISSFFTSTVAANLLVIVTIVLLEKNTRVNPFRRIDRPVARKMLKLSVPLVPNQLNWWIMSSSDRYIISYFLGSTANGIYAIAYKFPSVLQMVISLFTTSWQDVAVAEDSESGDNGEIFRKLYRFSFSLLFWVIPLTKLYIQFFMDPAYADAANYVPFLYLGSVFQGYSSFYGVGYLKSKHTKGAALTSVCGSVINILVHLALVRQTGIYAAAFSTFCGYLVMWYFREKQNRAALHIRIKWPEFLLYLTVTVVLSLLLPGLSSVTAMVTAALGLVLFLLINRKLICQILKKFLPL